MQTIAPENIKYEIIRLVDNSNEFLTIAVNFINYVEQPDLFESISNAKKKNVNILVYLSFDKLNFDAYRQFLDRDIACRFVFQLNTVLFLNEKQGIYSSVNLQDDTVSPVEFALLFNADETIVLREYIDNVIQHAAERCNFKDYHWETDKYILLLQEALSDYFEREIKCMWNNGNIEFDITDRFYVSLNKDDGKFSVNAVVKSDLKYFSLFDGSFSEKQNASVQQNNSLIKATLHKPLSSKFLDKLTIEEKQETIHFILLFVIEVQKKSQ